MEGYINSREKKTTHDGTTKPTPPLTERLRRKPGKVRIGEWTVENLIYYIL